MSVSQPPRSPTFSMLSSPPRSPSLRGRNARGGGVSGRRRRQQGPPPTTNSSSTTPAPPSRSWDDGDDPVPMRVWTPRWSTSDSSSSSRSTPDDDRSVASDPVSFLRARPMYPHKQQPSAAPHWIPPPISPNTNDTTTVDTTDDDDDVSTLGEEAPLRVQRWTTAVTLQVPPANMTRDERMLWKAIQNATSGRKNATTTQEEEDKEELLNTLTQERDEARAEQLLAQERWQQERLELQQQLEQLKLQQQQDSSKNTNDSDNNNSKNLAKQLQEKTTALESAKMIITSLEHASGCLKTELRQKLKDQQQQMEQIQATNQAQQTSIAHMTLELKQARKEQANDRQRKEQLQSILRHNLHRMREAGVVLEATQDVTAVDTLSRLLQETMQALEPVAHDENNNNNSTDQGSLPKRRCVTARSRSSSSSSDEEEDHNEQQLQRLQDEHRRLLKEQERKYQTELSALDQQKQELQNQCRSHLAVLARKEQELAVLRRDRNVDQDNQTGGMGYISDEESDDEEDDNHHHSDGTSSSPDQQYYSASSSNSNNNTTPSDTYDPSQAAALANLLLANGNPADSGVILQCQLIQTQSQAEQARQELQAERQSLANAKMIISSLEKANSQMMEDLRSRLHDSNTAIASLLEKSLKAEANTAKLRDQLETVQREKQQEHERMQREMDRLRRQQQQGTTTAGNTWSATTLLQQQQQYREEKKDEVIETVD